MGQLVVCEERECYSAGFQGEVRMQILTGNVRAKDQTSFYKESGRAGPLGECDIRGYNVEEGRKLRQQSSRGEGGEGGEDTVNRGFQGEAEKPDDVFRWFLSDTRCATPVSLLYL